MKKLIIALVCMASAGFLHAEDAIQVVPFETKAGANVDDAKYFSIAMNNASAEIWALQFDLLLPEGMKIDNESGYDPFELNTERFPHTTGRGGAITWKHTVYYDLLESGWYRIIVFTSEAERIIGNSGELLNIYYLTDENMQPGLHPIYIKGAVLTITGDSDIKPMESTSYCWIGESPLKSEEKVELKELTGYIPSFTIEAMNEEMAANKDITLLDISEADFIGAVPVVGGNGLALLSASAAGTETLIGAANIVAMNDDGNTCSQLNLTDEDRSFCSPCSFKVSNVNFDRVFKAGQWSTVCLPFSISTDQLAEISKSGVEVERLASYDAASNMLKFETVSEMSANTPYIVRCKTDSSPFADLVNVQVSASDVMNDIESNNVTMAGVFSTTRLDSDASVSYYGYNSVDGTFVKVGSNGTVYPFRAFISIPTSSANARYISVSHTNDMETGITDVEKNLSEAGTDVYSIDGRLVGKELSGNNADNNLPKGVYVIGEKKVIIK